jgi:hypothetical protein
MFRGQHPLAYEPSLAYAAAQQWIAINGDQVWPGAVDPRPMEPIADERSTSPGGRWI